MSIENKGYDKERLRWQCRRGMLELDMLLENFLDQQFDHLSAIEQNDFIQLLKQPDPFLISWITEDNVPPPFSKIIQLIKMV